MDTHIRFVSRTKAKKKAILVVKEDTIFCNTNSSDYANDIPMCASITLVQRSSFVYLTLREQSQRAYKHCMKALWIDWSIS